MKTTFREWLSNEAFTVLPHNPGDLVYFGVHDVCDLDDNQPLDVRIHADKISPICGVDGGNLLVEKPNRSRHRGMRRYMSKDGDALRIPAAHLHQIPSHLVDGMEDGRKIYVYAPRDYHQRIIGRKNRRMVRTADRLPEPGDRSP